MTTLIEIGHIYQDTYFSTEQIKAIQYFKSLELNNYKTILMTDDYNIKQPLWNKEYIISCYKENNITINYLNTESNMILYTEKILNILSPYIIKEYFRKENKNVYFYKDETYKIALYSHFLKDNTFHYTCSCLALCWALYKINYFNDFADFANQIVILPKFYQPIENNVMYLMKYFLSEKYYSFIYYFF